MLWFSSKSMQVSSLTSLVAVFVSLTSSTTDKQWLIQFLRFIFLENVEIVSHSYACLSSKEEHRWDKIFMVWGNLGGELRVFL